MYTQSDTHYKEKREIDQQVILKYNSNNIMSGKELREILASKGILQKDVAQKLNMTAGSFTQLLRAQDIKTGLLESICRVLNVKLNFFYEGTEYIESNIVIKKEDFEHLSSKIEQIHKTCEEMKYKD